MKKLMLSISLLFVTTLGDAQALPGMQAGTAAPKDSDTLHVAVMAYAAPFVMRASNDQFYGFDISMMNYLCESMGKKCQFMPMSLVDLIHAVLDNKVDLALSSFVITPEHAQYVQFSIPYMVSEAQFLGKAHAVQNEFNISTLNNKKIGVIQNSIYGQQIKTMNIVNPDLVYFISGDQLISALQSGYVDFILIEKYSATYWQSNSGGSLITYGTPISVGYGLGIVTNLSNQALITEVDNAILRYQNSPQFKIDYNTYLQGM